MGMKGPHSEKTNSGISEQVTKLVRILKLRNG